MRPDREGSFAFVEHLREVGGLAEDRLADRGCALEIREALEDLETLLTLVVLAEERGEVVGGDRCGRGIDLGATEDLAVEGERAFDIT